jgi:hypothetical protein
MCEECVAAEKQSNALSEKVAELLTEHKAGNLAVFFVGAKLMVSALAAIKMPPKEFLEVVCGMYTNCTGIDIIPLQMGPITPNPEAKDAN